MFRTPGPGDSISVTLSKLLHKGRKASQAIHEFATTGAGSLKIRYQVKEFSILCMGRCKPLDSLNSTLPYAVQLSGASLVSRFTLRRSKWLLLASPRSSAITMGVAASPGPVLGALIHNWRPEIVDGCDISHLLIWQEIFSFHKLMKKTQSWTFLYVLPWDVTSPVFNLFLGTRLGCGFQSGNLLVGKNGYSFSYPA